MNAQNVICPVMDCVVEAGLELNSFLVQLSHWDYRRIVPPAQLLDWSIIQPRRRTKPAQLLQLSAPIGHHTW